MTGPFANASAWMTTYLQAGGNLYTDETGTTSYTPDAQFRQYRDLAGNINPVTGTITIGPQPVLLETGTP